MDRLKHTYTWASDIMFPCKATVPMPEVTLHRAAASCFSSMMAAEALFTQLTSPQVRRGLQGLAYAAPASQHRAQAALAPVILLETRPLSAHAIVAEVQACLRRSAQR